MTNYWLDLFTGRTWKEFRDHGSKVSGFRGRRKGMVRRIQPGDILLCYLTGVMRWVGALRVLGVSKDKSPIWSGEDFMERLDVELLAYLDPESGIPMQEFEGRLDFYRGTQDRGKFKGFIRGSPNLFKKPEDGKLIFETMRQAEKNPVRRPVDEKKLNRTYRATKKIGSRVVQATVTIPEKETDLSGALKQPEATIHTRIQHVLLTLGAQMGLKVWVASNDRSRTYESVQLGSMPGVIDELPTQFNEVTTRAIELIDVLWLKGNSIVAAFEVESTTSIYSGLLRMSDLLALQPNINIRLFLVAPEERRGKVQQEVLRPTFELREQPLKKLCGFISFERLIEKYEAIKKMDLGSALKPEFIEKMAEYFEA